MALDFDLFVGRPLVAGGCVVEADDAGRCSFGGICRCSREGNRCWSWRLYFEEARDQGVNLAEQEEKGQAKGMRTVACALSHQRRDALAETEDRYRNRNRKSKTVPWFPWYWI